MIVKIILWSKVVEGSEELIIVFGQFWMECDLRASEIANLIAIFSLLADKDVLGFEVEVHQFFLQQFQEGWVHLYDEAEQFFASVDLLDDLFA